MRMKSGSVWQKSRVADDNLIERGVKRRRASCQFSLPSVALDAVNAAAKLLGGYGSMKPAGISSEDLPR